MSSKKNLILNGNFSKGNRDFTTDYNYVAPNPENTTVAGDYSVVSNPGMQVGGGFSSFGDHTGGGGQMLLLDGSTNQSDFWGQNVTLAANTSYSFTYFVTGADGEGAPPQIGLTVDGDQVDAGFRSSAYGGGAGWQQVTVSFTTIQAGSYALALHDADTSPSGNDFAVDDISLSKVAAVPSGQNLLVNGDFESSTQGFSSDYTHEIADPKATTKPGYFSVISNPAKD